MSAVEDVRGICMKQIVDDKKCTGCAACAAICPSNAIKMTEDKMTHFLYPNVDMSKCIDCNLCRNVCPQLHEYDRTKEALSVYAANNRNLNERMLSASGGIFRALAAEVLSYNGVVAGVRYTSVDRCEHCVITDQSDLDALCGTKYFQSDSLKVYRELKRFADSHNVLMFCGTPCQAASVKRYAKINGFADRLFAVEVLCRGISPAFLQKRYISWLEEQYQKKIVSIHYKEKTKGWKNIGTTVTFSDGESAYIAGSKNCLAQFSYGGNISLRESCYHCTYKTVFRNADITIGDFWGYENPDLVDNLGTSFVMVNTEKGAEILATAKWRLDMVESSVQKVVEGNRFGFHDVECDRDKRTIFWDRLNSGDDLWEMVNEFC